MLELKHFDRVLLNPAFNSLKQVVGYSTLLPCSVSTAISTMQCCRRQILRTAEVETLMHYAIDLLGFVKKQTQLSIETANVILASRLKIAA
jgi:hypothetical protein